MCTIKAQDLANLGVSAELADGLAKVIDNSLVESGPVEAWRVVSQSLLSPSVPFEAHRLLFDAIFHDWPRERGPAPAWSPTGADVADANVTSLMHRLGRVSYEDLHDWTVVNRDQYWREVADRLGIQFRRRYSNVLDQSASVEAPKWFVGATLNISDSCFRADPDSHALISQSENGPITVMTVRQLDALSNRVANGFVALGFAPGDRVAIAMPMTPIAVAAYIGVIKAGCIVVSVADSFAAPEIAARLRIGQARAIVTQDVIARSGKLLPIYEKVVAANTPQAIVTRAGAALNGQLRPGDILWDDFLSSNDEFATIERNPDDAINILFSSGTSGEPKAIPWTQTTPIKCAADACYHHNVNPSDVLAWPTNLGWMMGPWLIFAALLNQATIAMYDGSPAESEFGQFIYDARVTMLGVVPSLVSSWRRDRSMETFDWSAVSVFSSTGEASNADDMLYLMSLAGYRPVIEYCGGTEIGGGYFTGVVVRPCAPATFNTLALGIDAVILDENGTETDNGELFLVPPSIGLSTVLLNADHHKVYYENVPNSPSGAPLRRHGDQIERLGGGYYRAHGRIDDTMNLGGIKVSSAEIERALVSFLDLKEAAAIAVNPPGGGPSRLVIYVVLNNVQVSKAVLIKHAQDAIKRNLNPLFRVHDVVVVESLPRTASNKVMRRVLRDRYEALDKGEPKL